MNQSPRPFACGFLGILLFLLVCIVGLRAADQSQDEKIRQLEKRIEQLEKLLNEKLTPPVPPPAPPVPPGTPAISATAPPSAGAGTDTPGAPKAAASISAGASGFAFRSADSNFVVRLRGLLQLDSRWYVDDGGIKDKEILQPLDSNLTGFAPAQPAEYDDFEREIIPKTRKFDE